jgi:hypothetical protein
MYRWLTVMCVSTALSLALLALWPAVSLSPVSAQAAAGPGHTETHLYFGLGDPGGDRVTQEEWMGFVAEVITPRFPDGLTILTAYGQSRAPGAEEVVQEDTRLLIIVHEATPEDAERLEEIKRAYEDQFGVGGAFHTQAPVEVISGGNGNE